MLIPLTGSILRPRAVGAFIPGDTTDATLAMLRQRRDAQASDAWNRGQAAFAAGDLAEAARWLDRARRIAPDDQTVALVLAMVRLRQGDADAIPLFEALLRRHDLRTAWLGLAQARRIAGRPPGRRRAFGRGPVPPRRRIDAALAELAETIAASADAAGWCALEPDLRLTATLWRGRLRLLLDGEERRWPAGAVLPAGLAAGPIGWTCCPARRGWLGSPIRLDLHPGGGGLCRRCWPAAWPAGRGIPPIPSAIRR